MDNRMQRPEELQISRQAVEWLSTLEESTPKDREAFVAWLSRSPVHVQEFLNMTAVDRYFDQIPRDYPLDLAKLRKSPHYKVFPVVPAERASFARRGSPPRSRRWMSAVAAAAAVVAMAAWWWTSQQSAQRYTTSIGEQRAIELQDGSVIHVNANSSVEVRFGTKARDIHLVQGEALFKVKHDPIRPFRVHADQTVIQAIGTQFNVYRRETETKVAVLEGVVRILSDAGSSPSAPVHTESDSSAAAAGTTVTTAGDVAPVKIAAGEEVHIASGGHITARRKLDVAQAAVWRQRRLIFDESPLSEIVAEFNRYNRQPQLRAEGEASLQRRFTGVFDADDPESLVELLAKDGRLAVERRQGVVVIRAH